MTRLTGNTPVPANERKRSRVIIVRVSPAGRSRLVTDPAVERKTGLRMIRLLCQRIRLGMAIVAHHRRAGIFLPRVADVAGFTISDCVRAGEGESHRRMQLQRASTVLPVARRMAVLTIRPELAIVVVGVTIYTGDSHVAERRALVAADTLRRGVRTHQNKTGGGMVKAQRIAHLRPGFGAVTVLTVPLQFPMRILHGQLTENRASR